jgi:hypothetical protein
METIISCTYYPGNAFVAHRQALSEAILESIYSIKTGVLIFFYSSSPVNLKTEHWNVSCEWFV